MSNETICCPHCSHKYDSEVLELLDLDVVHDFRCEHCARPFVALIKECQMCNSDSIFAWVHLPAPAVLAELCCTNCKQPLNREDEPEE
jgi:hypothetical protein